MAEQLPTEPEGDPGDPYGVKAAQEHLARCEDAHRAAVESVNTLHGHCLEIAARHATLEHAIALGWVYDVPERTSEILQEGRTASVWYKQACALAQHRLEEMERVHEALQQAQEREREAHDRVWLQEYHPALVEDLDREMARLHKINCSAEPGVYTAQRQAVQHIQAQIREVLQARDHHQAAAD